jgi:hypothetical protein
MRWIDSFFLPFCTVMDTDKKENHVYRVLQSTSCRYFARIIFQKIAYIETPQLLDEETSEKVMAAVIKKVEAKTLAHSIAFTFCFALLF